MLKKSLLVTALFFGTFSAASYAGGGDSSWHPNVEPINCVLGGAGGANFYWADKKDCNDVIDNNYAKGVHYSGYFLYDDGSEKKFDAYVSPTNSYKATHPQGRKVKSLINTQWSWLR
jgi:hypothetical protein